MSAFPYKHLAWIALLALTFPVHADQRPLFDGSSLIADYGYMGGTKVLVDGFAAVDASVWNKHLKSRLASNANADRLATALLSSKLTESNGALVVQSECKTANCVSYRYVVGQSLTGEALLTLNKLLPVANNSVSVKLNDKVFDDIKVTFERRGLLGKSHLAMPIDVLVDLSKANEVIITHKRGDEVYTLTTPDKAVINQAAELNSLLTK